MPNSDIDWRVHLEPFLGREVILSLRPEWTCDRVIEQGVGPGGKPIQVTHSVPAIGVLEALEAGAARLRQTVSEAGDTGIAFVPYAAIATLQVASDLATPGSILQMAR